MSTTKVKKRKLPKNEESLSLRELMIEENEDDYLVMADKNEDEDEEDSDYEDLTDDEVGSDEDEEAQHEGTHQEKEESEPEVSEDEGNESREEENDKERTNDEDEASCNGEASTSSEAGEASTSGEAKTADKGSVPAKELYDEYEEDSSDEEDLRNTIGNIPIKWYDEYPHIGYDLDGKKVIKPKRGDKLDQFLSKLENPDHDRIVLDKQTGQDVRLSDGDLDIVQRVMGHKVPDASYDYYAPWVDLYSHEVMEMPLSGRPDHKRSFLPCPKDEKKVSQYFRHLRQKNSKLVRKKEPKQFEFEYDLWKDDPEPKELVDKITNHLPAPKEFLPGHGGSYRPPPEFVFSEEEAVKWKERLERSQTDPGYEFKDYNFIPRIFQSLRTVPGYPNYLKERFERCMDLYVAPRKKIYRSLVKPNDLLPVLPRPRDLRPFPTMQGIIFKGHRSIVRSISVHPLGRYLASGSDDKTVKIWEISTGRCVKSFDVEGAVKCVAWNPHKELFLLAVVFDRTVVLLNPESYLVDRLVVQKTNSAFQSEPDQGDYIIPDRISSAVTWRKATAEEWAKGYRCVLIFFKELKSIVWHRQGDYFATLIPEGIHRSVLMHQLSRWRSQVVFNKSKGRVQAISFHPKLPYLYVCSETHIRVYHLQKQELLKKVKSHGRHISCIAVHPGGEHFLIGTYDKRVVWFEMEYTRRPLMLRYHHDCIRAVAYHRKYPLFASASDDGRIIVAHGMVYNDLLKDPLLVPVKELHGHSMFDDYFVLDIAWHPYQPFLITAGADSTIRLWH